MLRVASLADTMPRCQSFGAGGYVCCVLLLALVGTWLWPALASAAGVQVRFGTENPAEGPFPSNLFTVTDGRHNTGIRINLPFPNCEERPSDCEDLNVLNPLDGFNLQPRLSVPFNGAIDIATVTSETVFLINLKSSSSPHLLSPAKVIGINQIVWDPATNVLYAESDEALDQHTTYALIVARGVRDVTGDPVAASGMPLHGSATVSTSDRQRTAA